MCFLFGHFHDSFSSISKSYFCFIAFVFFTFRSKFRLIFLIGFLPVFYFISFSIFFSIFCVVVFVEKPGLVDDDDDNDRFGCPGEAEA